jgi:hypothetical protein
MQSSSAVDVKSDKETKSSNFFVVFEGFGILYILFWIVFSYGAAKLSYDKYRSIGWAILDFFFSTFYYPYYALVLNSPTQAIIAAGRRR